MRKLMRQNLQLLESASRLQIGRSTRPTDSTYELTHLAASSNINLCEMMWQSPANKSVDYNKTWFPRTPLIMQLMHLFFVPTAHFAEYKKALFNYQYQLHQPYSTKTALYYRGRGRGLHQPRSDPSSLFCSDFETCVSTAARMVTTEAINLPPHVSATGIPISLSVSRFAITVGNRSHLTSRYSDR